MKAQCFPIEFLLDFLRARTSPISLIAHIVGIAITSVGVMIVSVIIFVIIITAIIIAIDICIVIAIVVGIVIVIATVVVIAVVCVVSAIARSQDGFVLRDQSVCASAHVTI